MLKTLGDVIQRLVEREREHADKFALSNHPVIIGDMYEGIARSVADKTLLPVGDFRVVKGQIRNSKGATSRQIDCMVVEGTGEQVPNTDWHIYPIDRVVAVFEIKKTLYKDDLLDALNLMSDLWTRIAEPKAIDAGLLRDAWRQIHGTELPTRSELKGLSPNDQLLFHALTVEANLPVRIVWGFHGYADESNLRKGLVDLLDEQVKKGPAPFGPVAMPNLVISNGASLIKLNGMPYGAPLRDGWWRVIGSRHQRPLDVLLELLWTRFTYYFGASNVVFGEDRTLDAVTALFETRPQQKDGLTGWELSAFPTSVEEIDDIAWEPTRVSAVEAALIKRLGDCEAVAMSDPDVRLAVAAAGTTLETVVERLQAARLVYVRDGVIRLLTTECECALVEGIGYVAAENKTGRLTRWIRERRRP